VADDGTRRLEEIVAAVSKSYQEALKDLIASHIAADMGKFGLVLTASQRADAASQVLEGTGGKLTIDIDNSQIEQLRAQHSGALPDIAVDLTEAGNDLDKLELGFGKAVSATVHYAIEELTTELLENWRLATPDVIAQLREAHAEFYGYIRSRWGEALDYLDALIDLLSDIGSQLYDSSREVQDNSVDPVIDVLFSLHMRACQVAREAAVLLKTGLPDGALARWRTLHELAVTAAFIGKHGAEIARRYMDHADMQTYRAAKQYQVHCAKLGREPLPAAQMAILETRKRELVLNYTREFESDYGWALPALSLPVHSSKPRRPKFSEIEADVELNFVRPFFQTASDNIHAGSRGTAFRLSSAWSGASDVGLQLPGRNTAWSLIQITVELLSQDATLERVALSKAIQELGKSVYKAFDSAS
jgi:hypothetical protein